MYFENKMAELFYEPSYKIMADAQTNVLVGTTLPVALCSYNINAITLVNFSPTRIYLLHKRRS